MLCDLVKLQGAPELYLERFSREPLQYNYFITIFKDVVESKVRNPKGRLLRLTQFTTEEAKELIKECIYQTAVDGYATTKSLLAKSFGDPYRILAAYRSEFCHWKQFRFGDAAGFQKFYAFFIKCNNLVTGHQWNGLDSPDNLCVIVSKLPGSSRDRCNRRAMTVRTKF